MLKRVLVLCGMMFLLLSGQGATVVWNALEVRLDEGCYVESYMGKCGSLSLGIVSQRIGTEMYSVAFESVNLLFVGTWMEAALNDIAGVSTIRNDASVLAYTVREDGDFWVEGGAPISVKSNSDFYLMFACNGLDEHLEVSDTVYGWVGYHIDQRGQITVLSSAWDLDGGPMIVGGGSATPEPSGGLLLVLGAAALALRRKNGVNVRERMIV